MLPSSPPFVLFKKNERSCLREGGFFIKRRTPPLLWLLFCLWFYFEYLLILSLTVRLAWETVLAVFAIPNVYLMFFLPFPHEQLTVGHYL